LLFETPSEAKWTGLCQMQIPGFVHQYEDQRVLQVFVDKDIEICNWKS
jgi:hypothetical protein